MFRVLRRPRFWLISFLCAILAGATTLAIMVSTNRTEAKFKKIRLGMNWDEVESIMGPPTHPFHDLGNGEGTVGWHGYDGGFSIFLRSGTVADKDSIPMKTPWDRLRAMSPDLRGAPESERNPPPGLLTETRSQRAIDAYLALTLSAASLTEYADTAPNAVFHQFKQGHFRGTECFPGDVTVSEFHANRVIVVIV